MTVIDKKQGAVKSSEVASDEALKIIETQANEDQQTVNKQIVEALSDSLRRINYLLHSIGQMKWDGSSLYFDSNATGNDLIFKLLQTESFAPRTINLKLTGSIAAPTSTTFQSIPIADGEVLYLELDRDTILNSAGEVIIENAINGGSIISGKTAKIVTTSAVSGLPALTTQEGGNTNTFAIPICYRKDYTIGPTTYQDLYWIPHGIRWPKDTTSTVGAVISEGIEAYPNKFASTLLELQTAASDLNSAGGGVILITENISIDSNISLNNNIVLLSRGDKTLTFLNGAQLTIGTGCLVKDIKIVTDVAFTGSAIRIDGNRSKIDNVSLNFTNSVNASGTKGFSVWGDYNEINRCKLTNFDGGGNSRLGIVYEATADNNADINTEWA